MRKLIMFIGLMSASLFALAQSASDYNYSIGIRAYSLMQLPKILNQTNTQDYTSMLANGALIKFNDNQVSYRISGNYFRDDISFDNTCATCEISKGKVTDYSFKVGFEKNFTYSRVQPYFAFDIGYRSNRFTGTTSPKSGLAGVNEKTVDANKNGLVMSPVLGIKVNIIDQITLFAESSLDFYYSYEKQDISEPNGIARTVNSYRKWEFLLNPVSAGIQFNIKRKN
jgi:hypothetical protein